VRASDGRALLLDLRPSDLPWLLRVGEDSENGRREKRGKRVFDFETGKKMKIEIFWVWLVGGDEYGDGFFFFPLSFFCIFI